MTQITLPEMFLRISLAFVAGFLVGWERETHGRPAGLRTNILACVAAAVSMIISADLLGSVGAEAADYIRADPARLGAGMLAGMGFLGGGTILRHENFIRGVTTAATLWTVTILGLAFGAGLFALGAIGVAFSIVTLLLLTRLEKGLKSDWYATLTVVASTESASDIDFKERVERLGAKVLNLKLRYELAGKRKTLTCELKLKRQDRFQLPNRIIQDLAQSPEVVEVSWA
jgi:putative Mg2+ transporter-C (MgtC) family protein